MSGSGEQNGWEEPEGNEGTSPTAAERAVVIAATRFRLGKVYLTPGAEAAFNGLPQGNLTADELTANGLITRHLCGDWGDDMDAEDRAANDRAIRSEERILSSYVLSDGTKLWIITEADRSATTLLLPDEY